MEKYNVTQGTCHPGYRSAVKHVLYFGGIAFVSSNLLVQYALGDVVLRCSLTYLLLEVLLAEWIRPIKSMHVSRACVPCVINCIMDFDNRAL